VRDIILSSDSALQFILNDNKKQLAVVALATAESSKNIGITYINLSQKGYTATSDYYECELRWKYFFSYWLIIKASYGSLFWPLLYSSITLLKSYFCIWLLVNKFKVWPHFQCFLQPFLPCFLRQYFQYHHSHYLSLSKTPVKVVLGVNGCRNCN